MWTEIEKERERENEAIMKAHIRTFVYTRFGSKWDSKTDKTRLMWTKRILLRVLQQQQHQQQNNWIRRGKSRFTKRKASSSRWRWGWRRSFFYSFKFIFTHLIENRKIACLRTDWFVCLFSLSYLLLNYPIQLDL